MIDYYNLADNQYHTQIYFGTNLQTGLPSPSIYFWVKPRGITMVHITAIGGGGGGGAGVASATSTAGSGGSGGGSGAITRLTIPAIFLPDSLEITVGFGGNGATAGNGVSGGNTVIDSARGSDVGATRIILAGGGVSGAGGSAAGGALGGAGGGIGVLTNGVYQALGTWVSVAGQIGASNTASGGAGQSVTIVDTGLPITGGASGGGKTAANGNNVGGDVIGFGSAIPTIPGGSVIGTIGGTSGVFSQTPFYSLGGAGGGANAAGTGGRGGNGAIGCGGGGGGAGLTGSPGPGGNGGPGIVIITCW